MTRHQILYSGHGLNSGIFWWSNLNFVITTMIAVVAVVAESWKSFLVSFEPTFEQTVCD